jgi:sulfur carrier protein
MGEPCIIYNGEKRPLAAATLASLLRQEGVAVETRGLAVALNDAVVPRRAWEDTAVQPGDRVEVVKVFSGG